MNILWYDIYDIHIISVQKTDDKTVLSDITQWAKPQPTQDGGKLGKRE